MRPQAKGVSEDGDGEGVGRGGEGRGEGVAGEEDVGVDEGVGGIGTFTPQAYLL